MIPRCQEEEVAVELKAAMLAVPKEDTPSIPGTVRYESSPDSDTALALLQAQIDEANAEHRNNYNNELKEEMETIKNVENK